MSVIGRLYRRLQAYLVSDDPRVAIANTVAAAIVWNQPFYPLYVWWIAGDRAWLSCVTFVSTPFFAAVPALARKRPLTGRLLLLAAGIGNTALCTCALGRASGVELFYLPCLALGFVTFGRGERLLGIAAAAAIGCLILALGHAVPAAFTRDENTSLLRLHAGSVICLLALMAYACWKAGRSRAQ